MYFRKHPHTPPKPPSRKRRKRYSVVLVVLLVAGGAEIRGQHLRLNPLDAPTSLYLNLSQILRYNVYEHFRFGAGFLWEIPNDASRSHYWQLSAYAAYGTYDRQLKYGGTIAVQFRGPRRWRPFIDYIDDVQQAASTNLAPYVLLLTQRNTSYVASYFTRMRALTVGFTTRIDGHLMQFDLRYVREWQLFDERGALYPAPLSAAQHADYGEAHAQVGAKGMLVDVRGGLPVDGVGGAYMRAIVQYDSLFELDDRAALYIFGQVGYATAGAPVQRLFDLSGTRGSFYYFENVLLTLRPNTFLSDLYGRTTVQIGWNESFWQTKYSCPSAFAQVGGVVGRHYDTQQWDCMIEPGIGIDRLLRWGYLDVGVAAAYGIVPRWSPLWQPRIIDRFAFLAVAKILL